MRAVDSQDTKSVGTVSVTNGNKFQSTSTNYASDGDWFYDRSVISTGKSEGTLISKQSINGTWEGHADSGTLSLNYSPIYERTSSLSKLSGRWEFNDVHKSMTYYLNINSSGQITGGDSTYYVCGINGTVSVISSSYNAYRVNVTLANCGTGNDGSYSGLAYLDDTVSLNDTFMFIISKSDRAISAPYLKR